MSPRTGPLGLLLALLVVWTLCNAWQSQRLLRRVAIENQPPIVFSDPQQRQRLFHQLALDGETAPLVLAGDSHIQHGDWRALLGRPVANRGLNGETLAGFAARLPDLLALKPSTLVVQIGGNDLEGIVLPPEERQAFLKRYAAVLEQLDRGAPETRVLLTGILPVTDQHRGGPPSNAQLPALNEALFALCRRHPRCQPLDPAPLLHDDAGNLRRDYSLDTEHLNAVGYALWAGQISAQLPPAPAR